MIKNEERTDEKSEHRAVEDPSGLALRCSCGSWSMLYRNSFGLNAVEEHHRHAAERPQ